MVHVDKLNFRKREENKAFNDGIEQLVAFNF